VQDATIAIKDKDRDLELVEGICKEVATKVQSDHLAMNLKCALQVREKHTEQVLLVIIEWAAPASPTTG